MIYDFQFIDLLVILSIALVKFGVGFVTSMVIPVFPTLISMHFNDTLQTMEPNLNLTDYNTRNPKFNYYQLSILFSTKNFVQIIMSPLIGYWSEFIGPLNVILIGIILQISTILFYGLGNKYYFLIIGRVCEGFANTALTCSVISLIAYQYTDQRKLGFIYGIGGLALCVGGAVGPAYGGVVFQYYGKLITFLSTLSISFLEFVLILSLILSYKKIKKGSSKGITKSLTIEIANDGEPIPSPLATDILLQNHINNNGNANGNEMDVYVSNISNTDAETKSCLCLDEKKEKIKTDIPNPTRKNKHSVIKFFTDPYFMIILGSFPVVFISLFMYLAVLPSYMRITFGASESQQGIIWLLNLIGYIVGFVLGNFLNIKLSKYRHILLVGIIYLQAISSIILALMPSWWSVAIPLCFVIKLQLVYEILISPLVATVVERNHNSKFGIMSGITMMAIAITSSVGSYVGPLLLSKIGFLYLNIIILLLGIIYGPLLLFLKKFVIPE